MGSFSSSHSTVIAIAIGFLMWTFLPVKMFSRRNNNSSGQPPQDMLILGRLQKQLEVCANKLDEAMEQAFWKTVPSPKTRNNTDSTESSSSTSTAAICAIQKGGLNYIDEWVDYHLALGFSTIYIYDNSDDFELRRWADARHPRQVVVRHFPGARRQLAAYDHCVEEQRRWKELQNRFRVSEHTHDWLAFLDINRFRVSEHTHDWLAFLDIDEFIVLKKKQHHGNILNLLEEFVPQKKAGLTLHRMSFYFDIDDNDNAYYYEPIPVTKRFQHRLVEVDKFVKTISRTAQISLPIDNVHHVNYVNKRQSSVDTGGRKVMYGYSPKRPADVAVVHHYETKSLQEFRSKCRRGDAIHYGTSNTNTSRMHNPCPPRDSIIETFRNETIKAGGVTFDDGAWQFLYNAVPQYSLYNNGA
jgi:hypothetical protein